MSSHWHNKVYYFLGSSLQRDVSNSSPISFPISITIETVEFVDTFGFLAQLFVTQGKHSNLPTLQDSILYIYPGTPLSCTTSSTGPP